MRYIEEHKAPNVEIRDAARQLGVSFRELYHLIDAGKLPAYKVGRDIKLRQADVNDFRRGRAGGE
jgi:excisionase family DNA binding protein